MKTIDLADLVQLGEILSRLMNPHFALANAYMQDARTFIGMLEKYDLTSSRATASAIEGLNLQAQLSGKIFPQNAADLLNRMNVVSRALYHELSCKKSFLANTAGVSAKLRDLPTQITLNPIQTGLLVETIRCIESEIFRAGAVSGWNLAYDYIRRWMWDDTTRRAAFNAQVMAKSKNNVPVYPNGITAYEEFYSIKPQLTERDVLDFMTAAGLLPGVSDRLMSHLRDRNSHAHANDLIPSIYQTNQYVENLVDIIVRPPFS